MAIYCRKKTYVASTNSSRWTKVRNKLGEQELESCKSRVASIHTSGLGGAFQEPDVLMPDGKTRHGILFSIKSLIPLDSSRVTGNSNRDWIKAMVTTDIDHIQWYMVLRKLGWLPHENVCEIENRWWGHNRGINSARRFVLVRCKTVVSKIVSPNSIDCDSLSLSVPYRLYNGELNQDNFTILKRQHTLMIVDVSILWKWGGCSVLSFSWW